MAAGRNEGLESLACFRDCIGVGDAERIESDAARFVCQRPPDVVRIARVVRERLVQKSRSP